MAVPRIPSQKMAAEMLRITPRRLRELEAESEWWSTEFRTDEGYDVVAIARAQLNYQVFERTGASSESDVELKARQLRAKVAREEAEKELAELKLWQEQAKRDEREGKILPADVYSEYSRELLGLIRTSLEDLPYTMSRQAPPAVRPFVWVDPQKQKTPKDAAPLQREVLKIITNISNWLNEGPTPGETE